PPVPPFPTRRSSDLFGRSLELGNTLGRLPPLREPLPPGLRRLGRMSRRRLAGFEGGARIDPRREVFRPEIRKGQQQIPEVPFGRSEEHTSELQSREN